MFVQIINGNATPITLTEFRKQHPQVSFPKELPPELLAEYGISPARDADRPNLTAFQRVTRSEAFTQVNGEWVRDWDVDVIEPSKISQMIQREANNRMEALASSYSRQERETWAMQVNEVNALKADPNAPAPFLRALANGQDISALAGRVLALADAFAAAGGAIMVCRNKLMAMDPVPEDFADDKHWLPQAEKQLGG